MLTDAVMTAVSVAEPFTDGFLKDLLPVVRHRSAVGLWRLVTARTSTGPEKAYLVDAERLRADSWGSDVLLTGWEQYLLRVTEILEREEGWLSSARFKQAVSLARRYLAGPRAKAGEEWLYAQGADFEETYQDCLQHDDGLAKHANRGYDWTGRGGTAVWRAERRVDLEHFEDWLVGRSKGDPAAGVMESGSPGWLLRTPAAWQARAFQRTAVGQLPEPYARWTCEGRVLVFPYRSGQAVWPLRQRPAGAGWEPVPGAEPLAAAAAGLRAEKVLGFIEAALIEWNQVLGGEATDHVALDLPVGKAHDFGFITAEERHAAMAEARAATLERMDAFIESMEGDGEADGYMVRELRDARGNVREFRSLARRYGRGIPLRFDAARAFWRWPKGSIVSEVLAGTPPEVVHWLAVQAHRQRLLLLELAMQGAWRRAFDRFGFRL
ncbi:hypothetical protein ACH46F_32830 [Streptomyces virginiae]|uniref:hypothetical protein n=1 Tax=Streptomyces virginiae TaxID=1961 RepID=UPI0037A81055